MEYDLGMPQRPVERHLDLFREWDIGQTFGRRYLDRGKNCVSRIRLRREFNRMGNTKVKAVEWMWKVALFLSR